MCTHMYAHMYTHMYTYMYVHMGADIGSHTTEVLYLCEEKEDGRHPWHGLAERVQHHSRLAQDRVHLRQARHRLHTQTVNIL